MLRQFGPGLASGAADNDPSGIATYTQAGAQLGYAACWILLLCFPMMIATQEISARIGRATGSGVIAALRARYPRWLVHGLAGLVVIANTINLGADLGAMADVLQLLFGGSPLAYVALSGAVCVGLLLWLELERYLQFVKWAALSLVVYVLAAFSTAPSWARLLNHLSSQALSFDAPFLAIVVAVIGTTISPYLFIWQSSLEGERARGMPAVRGEGSASLAGREARRIRIDTWAGMALAALVAYAVSVTAASTLHPAGITPIETMAQAATALHRMAGPLAHLVFALGILATGLLAVPMLAASAAFAVAEGLRCPAGLAGLAGLAGPAGMRSRARAFQSCILAATAAGMAMNILGLNPVRALLWSAVINEVLAVPVLVGMMFIAGRGEIMGRLTLSRPLAAFGWLTAAVMGITAIVMLATIGQEV